jgi:hypothetical protein
MARPSKLDEQRMDLICKSLEVGATYKIAAQVANVHVSTLFAWIAKGKQEETGKFKEFSERIKRAEGMCAVRDLSIITRASETDWRAAAWRLERRFNYTTVQGSTDTPEEVNPEELDVKNLIQNIKESDNLIKQLTGPVIDLDEQ